MRVGARVCARFDDKKIHERSRAGSSQLAAARGSSAAGEQRPGAAPSPRCGRSPLSLSSSLVRIVDRHLHDVLRAVTLFIDVSPLSPRSPCHTFSLTPSPPNLVCCATPFKPRTTSHAIPYHAHLRHDTTSFCHAR
jgi:hypothetical protein